MKKLICIIVSVLLLTSHISVCAVNDTIVENVYTIFYDKASESGYSEIQWIDENGNKVDIPESEGVSTYSLFRSSSRSLDVLPSSYNANDNNVVTSVKDQGTTGSCWAFSMISAAESSILSKSLSQKDSLDLSEAHHVWFAHKSYVEKTDSDTASGDGVNADSPYESGGNWYRSTFALARGMGFAQESDYPFYPDNIENMGNYPESSRYVSKYYLRESHEIPVTETTTIKNKIITNGSVMAAFYMNAQYINADENKYCYYYPEESLTNHQITIVGWDDEYSLTNFKTDNQPEGNGAWIVKNSFGSSWGNDGFFYISYYDKTLKDFSCVDVTSSEDYLSIYQYDGYGFGTGVSASTSNSETVKTATMANVFTATKDESLKSVSFYTLNGAQDCTIEIYTGVSKDHTTPTENGKCVSTQTETFSYDGYHTVDLAEPVSITQGECFSVLVTITSETAATIAVEGQSGLSDGSFIRNYSSSSGQSYYKFGSSSWKESSTTNYNNVCIKALTSVDEVLKIETAQDLCNFSSSVNNGNSFKGKTVQLVNDIDASGIEFTPIGTNSNVFDGVFDGNGKVIKNLCVTNNDNAGLFGVTGENSVIKLLGVENANIESENTAGALIGKSNSNKIYNCYSTGKVSAGLNAGALIGINNSTLIQDCFGMADITGGGNIGSLVGYDNSTYENCYSLNNIGASGNNESISGLNLVSKGAFVNGEVAYKLQSDVITWTKGETNPVFSTDGNYKVNLVTVYDVIKGGFYYVYLTQYEDIYSTFEKTYVGKQAEFYTDYSCTNQFASAVTYNRTLYAKVTDITLKLKDSSEYIIEDGVLCYVCQATTVKEILSEFAMSGLTCINTNGEEMSETDVVGTGYEVVLKNSDSETVLSVKILVFGDLNSDGYIDAFDLSLLRSVANFETEFEEKGVLEKAGDLNRDSVIDSFDVSILTSVVNFEVKL